MHALPTPTSNPRPKSWSKRLYAKVASLAGSRYALWAMLAVSLIDSACFPIPPFAILVPMIIGKPRRWFWLGAAGAMASICGAFLGYELGQLIAAGALHFFSINVNAPVDHIWIFAKLGLHGSLGGLLGKNFWMLLVLCLLFPIFKVVAIGSGFVSVPLGKFFVAVVIGRSVRFLFVAASTAWATVKASQRMAAREAAKRTAES